MDSVTQEKEKVKCSYDGCEEEVFRHELCFYHLMEEEAELEGVSLGPPEPALDGGWWGYSIEEVCQ
jgi:hypothetical protein